MPPAGLAKAMATNAGSWGASAVRSAIQAPLTPRVNSAKGTTQQEEAPSAARMPTAESAFSKRLPPVLQAVSPSVLTAITSS